MRAVHRHSWDPWKEFLIFTPEDVSAPRMLFNLALGEESNWQHIPFQVLPPACTPHGTPTGAVALQVSGEPEDLVLAAIKNKTALNVEQIKALCQARLQVVSP